MKDIDFEELDRAVSSVIAQKNGDSVSTSSSLTQNQNQNQNITTPQEQVVSDNANLQPVVDTQPKSPQTIINSPAPINPLPTISVTPKIDRSNTVDRPKTGRFLDLVHPSANMRSPAGVSERNPQISNTTQPLTGGARSPEKISFVKPSQDDNVPFDINKFGSELDKNLGLNANEPKDTPFIQDAKVEKRPLNALVADGNKEANPAMPSFTPEQPKNVDTPLPAELQSDILSIEANEVTKDSIGFDSNNDGSEEPISQSVEASSPLVEEKMAEPKVESAIKSEKTPSLVEEIPKKINEPAKQTVEINSIPQQYEEKPSTVSQDSGAIYDVNNYHKAATPIKKKSGWSWVIWTIIIMVISVGAGVAVYFFILPDA